MAGLAPVCVASTMLMLEGLVEVVVAASATPLAISRVKAMVLNNSMVRLIRRPAFLGKGTG